jgi:lactobin A/cerein 7B family class IIb bacteriocin
MTSIRISDLSVDSESFLDELSESDLASINGGWWPFVLLGLGVAFGLRGSTPRP